MSELSSATTYTYIYLVDLWRWLILVGQSR